MATRRRFDAIAIGLTILCGAIGVPGRLEAQPSPPPTAAGGPKRDRYGDPQPPGAVLRLGTIRYRQDSPIYRIAYTPDGKHFVTDGQDSLLRVWDANTGRVVRRIDPEVGALEDFAITRRGDRVMAVGETMDRALGLFQNVTMIHLGTGHIEDRGEWPDGPVGFRALALCPDRALVAVGVIPSGVKVLDAWNGAELCQFETGGRKVDSLLFSPDGKRLAANSTRPFFLGFEHELRIYDLERKQELRVLRDRGGPHSDIAFSPDASLIAVSKHDDLATWVVATGERIPMGQPFVQKLGYSADGRILAGSDVNGAVKVFDSGTRKLVASQATEIGKGELCAISPDGRTLLIVTGGQVIHAWDIEARRDRFALPEAHAGPVRTLLVDPGAKTVITGGVDGAIRLWDLSNGRQTRVLRLPGPVELAALSPDGRRLAATSSFFHQVFVWDLSTASDPVVMSYRAMDLVSSPLAMQFADANEILVIDGHGKQHHLDVKERRTTSVVEPRLAPPVREAIAIVGTHLAGAEFLPGGKRLALTGPFFGLHIVESPTGRDVLQVEGGDRIAASPDGHRLAVAAMDTLRAGRIRRMSRPASRGHGLEPAASEGEIRILDAGTGRELQRFVVEGSEVWALAFSPDGRTLAATSGWESGQIHFYNVASGRETRAIDTPALGSPALAFTPDGSRLVAAMADGSILVWDARKGPPAK